MSESKSGITDSVKVEHTPAEEPARVVLNTDEAWTAQSQHGVLLNHFVPTQDYKAIENDPSERVAVDDGDDW